MSWNERSRVLASHERREGSSLEDDLFAALEAADVLSPDRSPPLAEFVNPTALEHLAWENPGLEVRTRVWEVGIRITADRIVVYAGE